RPRGESLPRRPCCSFGGFSRTARHRDGARGRCRGAVMTSVPPYSGWREPILSHFTQEIATVARLTIVVDPDRLLTEETILDGIRERGFDLIPFEDQVAFRFAYETRYRRAWDRGEE